MIQPVLSNIGEVSCTRGQFEPCVVFKLISDRSMSDAQPTEPRSGRIWNIFNMYVMSCQNTGVYYSKAPFWLTLCYRRTIEARPGLEHRTVCLPSEHYL